MKIFRNLILSIIFLMTLSIVNAQDRKTATVKTTSTTEKEYPFNPDYPDFYYGEHKIFLEAVYYTRNADLKKIKARYLITFSGMSSKGYVISYWGLNSLDEFDYYKDLIENKKYYRILLHDPKDNILTDATVLMNPKRKIPKL